MCSRPGRGIMARVARFLGVLHIIWLLLVAGGGGAFAPMPVFAADRPRMLLVSSHNSNFKNFLQQVSGLRAVLDPVAVELDVAFAEEGGKLVGMRDTFFESASPYSQDAWERYDLIFCADDTALEFALRHGDRLWGDAPRVFMGVHDTSLGMALSSSQRYTGIIEAVSIRQNIDLFARLFPLIDTIAVIVDATPAAENELQMLQELQREYPDYFFNVLSLAHMSWEEFGVALATLPAQSGALLLSAAADNTGEHRVFDRALSFILDHLGGPLLHVRGDGIGAGVVGGKVVCHVEQGRLAAGYALRFIQGESIKGMTVLAGDMANKYIFDARELERFGVDDKALPEDAELRYRTISLWQEYHQMILAVLAVGGLQVFFVAIFWTLRRRSHAMQKDMVLFKACFQHDARGMAVLPVKARTFAMVNARYAELFGYTRDELALLPVEVLHPESERAYFEDRCMAAMQTGEAVWKGKGLRKDGTCFAARIDIAVVYGDAGGMHRYLFYAQDISEQVEFQDLLLAADRKCMVGELAMDVAYGINNPLSTVLQSVQNLQRRLDPELPANAMVAKECNADLHAMHCYLERRNILRVVSSIRDAATYIADTTRNVMEFARIGEGDPCKCELGALLDSVLALAASDYELAKRRDTAEVRIIKDMGEKIPSVPCVRSEIERAFFNIIRSRIKALKDENHTLASATLTLRIRCENGWVVVAVQDGASGIKALESRQHFEHSPFGLSPGQSTGLGFAVSRFIVTRKHQGRVMVHSTPEDGSIIMVALPMQDALADQEGAPDFDGMLKLCGVQPNVAPHSPVQANTD